MTDRHDYARLAARAIIAVTEDDDQVHQLVVNEVAQRGGWVQYSAALTAMAAAITREIDDPDDGARALFLHQLAARM